MKDPNHEPTSISIDVDVLSLVKAHARKRRLSTSQVFETAVIRYLAAEAVNDDFSILFSMPSSVDRQAE